MKKIKIENRSILAICPDCQNRMIMRIDGHIELSEILSNVSTGMTKFNSLDDLDFDPQIKIRCKSCRDNHDCEDECITSNFAIERLLYTFRKFGYCGISTNRFCEIDKTPKLINDKMVMEFCMPMVSYLIPLNIKEKLESVLATLMIEPQMCETCYIPIANERVKQSCVILCYDAETDDTCYYHAKFYLDKDTINLIYDPEIHGKDYKNFVDRMFIKKIDLLASLLENIEIPSK